MAWSIFQQGGGDQSAGRWAIDLLQLIGAPLSPGNKQFIYDWEVSEGGGGAFNPLNQGPVPGHPSLTSTGPQYGGGAADFVSWQAGLQGASDYLGMANFAQIADDLRSNDPAGARTALIASPWAASHYGGGSAFSDDPFPGAAKALPPAGAVTTSSSGGGGLLGGLLGLGNIGTDITNAVITGGIILAAGLLGVAGLVKATGTSNRIQQQEEDVMNQAQAVAPLAVAAA